MARAGEYINDELADSNPVVFGVMNGGRIFAGKLLTHLHFPLEASYLHATRYRNETSGGDLFWKAKPEVSFIDRDVLIIDDILDEGLTLGAILDLCKHAGPPNVQASPNEEADQGLTLRASHEGYAARFGVSHARRMRMTPDGLLIQGEDILAAPKGLKGEAQASGGGYAVHFAQWSPPCLLPRFPRSLLLSWPLLARRLATRRMARRNAARGS